VKRLIQNTLNTWRYVGWGEWNERLNVICLNFDKVLSQLTFFLFKEARMETWDQICIVDALFDQEVWVKYLLVVLQNRYNINSSKLNFFVYIIVVDLHMFDSIWKQGCFQFSCYFDYHIKILLTLECHNRPAWLWSKLFSCLGMVWWETLASSL
jgi:hypothetical protein